MHIKGELALNKVPILKILVSRREGYSSYSFIFIIINSWRWGSSSSLFTYWTLDFGVEVKVEQLVLLWPAFWQQKQRPFSIQIFHSSGVSFLMHTASVIDIILFPHFSPIFHPFSHLFPCTYVYTLDLVVYIMQQLSYHVDTFVISLLHD